MNKRTKACAIPAKVKKAVEERDGHKCIFCGKPGRGEAHVIPRSHGGLGVEQNLVTVCRPCHFNMDDTVSRELYLELAKQHLRHLYPDWNEESLVYKKGEKTKPLEPWINKNLVNNGDLYIKNTEKSKKTEVPDGFRFL